MILSLRCHATGCSPAKKIVPRPEPPHSNPKHRKKVLCPRCRGAVSPVSQPEMPRDWVFSRSEDCAPAQTPALQSEAPETTCCVPGVAVLCPRCRHVRKVLERISSRNSLSTCSFQRYSAVARLQFHTPTHHVCRTGKQLCSAERNFSPHLWSAFVLQFGKAMRTSLTDFRCPSKASFSNTASPVTADPSHQVACCSRTRIPN